jgi:signal peptidase II
MRGAAAKMARGGARLVLGLAIVGTIGCDRVTKQVAVTTLAGTPPYSFLSDTIRLEYSENAGGFLSLGADLPPAPRTLLFTIATGLMLAALIGVTLRFRWTGGARLGLSLFAAGGASNWIDRVTRGSVVDFLNVGVGPLRTGIFNVADVAILAGAAIVVVSELRRSAPPTLSPSP